MWYLAENFKRCVGLDVSAAQIECGRKKVLEKGQSNLEFRVGDACDTGVETGSVDLLTCAQAWHWLDAENFYREASRALAPNGCLCLSHEGCQRVISDFYSNTLKGYWHPNRALISTIVTGVLFYPFPRPNALTTRSFHGHFNELGWIDRVLEFMVWLSRLLRENARYKRSS